MPMGDSKVVSQKTGPGLPGVVWVVDPEPKAVAKLPSIALLASGMAVLLRVEDWVAVLPGARLANP